MSVSTSATIFDVAQELLDVSEAILADTYAGPVALSYLSPGLPAIDYQCDQVAVYLASMTEEATSPLSPIPASGHRASWGWVNLVVFSIHASRCVDTGTTTKTGFTPPSVQNLLRDSRKVMEDGWALWNGIHYSIAEDTLFGGKCNDIKFVSMAPLVPQGGIAGWVLTVSAEMPGYRP